MTAVYKGSEKISYRQLLKLIDECKIEDPIFPVTMTLECVVKILTCLIKGIPFFPYSPQLLEKPQIKIPEGCDFILHTSGSSKMKYALFTKEALINSNMNTHPAFILKPDDVYLLNLPLYHVAGLSLIMRAFLRTAAIAIDPSSQDLITHISMVPAQTAPLLESRQYPNLKALLLGGNFIQEKLAGKLVDLGYPLYVTYGMTEMCSHIFVSKYTKETGVCFSAPLRGRQIQFTKDNVLQVSGCGKFISYIDSKEESFHHTKDIFTYENGLYRVQKRADKMFISGGENIFPEEIKRALLDHPSISCATVTIKQHLKWGSRPFATVTSKNLTKKEIQSFLASKLEKFKIPKDHELLIKKALNQKQNQ